MAGPVANNISMLVGISSFTLPRQGPKVIVQRLILQRREWKLAGTHPSNNWISFFHSGQGDFLFLAIHTLPVSLQIMFSNHQWRLW